MLENIRILYHQGKQFIPDVTTAKVPGIFRGRPVISSEKVDEKSLADLCPTEAITIGPVAIDMGKCTFCGECARRYPTKISFTTDYKISTNVRESLVISEGQTSPVELNQALIREEIRSILGRSLKIRQVSAAGDNSAEWELNAPSRQPDLPGLRRSGRACSGARRTSRRTPWPTASTRRW